MTAEGSLVAFQKPRAKKYSDRNRKTSQTKCCSPSLKIFICALAFCYFTKSMTGTYTKSIITQIERRFEIPSATVGIIVGSFEMGNLLVITMVSYFGAKFHRPRVIGAGVLLMGIGTLLMASPHFIMGRYKYNTAAGNSNDADNFTVSSTCSSDTQNTVDQLVSGCQKWEEEGSLMWVIVFLGNMIRGIGEASIVPLGLSFIDDYASPENSAFYIGCLYTFGVVGPIFGYLLGSLCANLYVDIGLVNQESVTITPQDSLWVGAWWLGYMVSGLLTLLAALPFWFLPRALSENPQTSEPDHLPKKPKNHPSITDIAKGFGKSLKRLLTNKIYFLYLASNIMTFSSFSIIVTYTQKYLEQQFGQSASKVSFFKGVTSIPAVVLAVFLSGWIMRRFKLDLLSSAKMALFTSVVALVLSLPCLALRCENIDVAGVTVPYEGSKESQGMKSHLLSSCNAGCGCSDFHWDPVCGENGLTYISPCHAGCNSTQGAGRNMTFHGCTCIQSWGLNTGNSSAGLGQCSRENSCSKMFYIYLALLFLIFFVYFLGTVPCFFISLRIVDPELKSLSVGVLLFMVRVLGEIPASIYFGALIDTTCLKWGEKKCGGRGACRLYDTDTFRFLFQGLTSCLWALSNALFWMVIANIKREVQNDKLMSMDKNHQQPMLCDPEKGENVN